MKCHGWKKQKIKAVIRHSKGLQRPGNILPGIHPTKNPFKMKGRRIKMEGYPIVCILQFSGKAW
jgi:hypothetical protein